MSRRQQVRLAQGWRVDPASVFAHFDRAGFRRRQAEVLRHALGQFQIDVGQNLIHLTRTDVLTLNLAQLEAVGRDDVLLLVLAHAVEEQPRLGEVIAERLAALADLVARRCAPDSVSKPPSCAAGGVSFGQPPSIEFGS